MYPSFKINKLKKEEIAQKKVPPVRLINNDNYNLFTIDVEKLYPNIQPHLAEEAISDLLFNVIDEEVDVAVAVKEFVKTGFCESYVKHIKIGYLNRK